VVYRVGAKDAEFMENEFMPTFTIQDLVNLTKFQIYLKLMIDGVSSNPFSANTLPPFADVTGNAEKVIKVSRERYAVPRAVIEEKVIKWSEPVEGEGSDTEERPRSKKPIYEATCSRCGKKFTVGFKFDPNRPIYCEDCLELVRSGAATPVRSVAPVIRSVALPPVAPAVVPSVAERPVIRSVASAPVLRTAPQPQPQQPPPSISLSALKLPPPPRPKTPELRKTTQNDAKPPLG